VNAPGRIVRFGCSCGWEGEDLLVGGGEAPEFLLVESFPCSCRRCKAVVHRFLPRAGAAPAAVEALAASRGGEAAPGGLPGRVLRAIAAEGASGRSLCPLCRTEELAVARTGPPPCPVCGRPCRETEAGSWR